MKTLSQAWGSEGATHRGSCPLCGVEVEISAFAWDVAKGLSKLLVTRGESPLGNDEISYCQDCGRKRDQRERDLARTRLDRDAALFARMRDMREMSIQEKDSWLRTTPSDFRAEYGLVIKSWRTNRKADGPAGRFSKA